ncbi:DUF4920 domain-containing protein [Dyadobacter chenhuakuii]|uniref:DUF4920 domain-containing protein n=1 Tax=Dyadobacter chenhuakuii TaxID=2909339 RepID=A0ABY4XKG3_9BACT|nr:DUF4920 domain-containing protein [Dyadobacter chenhuakuii]MCF2493787.1 DUF4920 domain-containing protein [Dyadobacter chenhuakuii]USJ30921.1 DUF4920 domain-containing protein [Dyadobacter chenhuakuii]
MKKVMMLMLLALGTLIAEAQTENHFGKEITESKAIKASTLPKQMGDKKEMAAKVSGEVESVCQVKGCWMTVKLDNGETMRVMFKDYGFFVPKDITGKTVVFEGQAQKKTIPVEHLQHYAKDAGQSQEEIAKITEPKDELTFVADGVIVK